MSTHTTVTADELCRMPDDGMRHELVAGELRTMAPAKGEHGHVAMRAGHFLIGHVIVRGLGRVYAAETGFLLSTNPDTVRAPDVAFVRTERVAKIDSNSYIRGAPDLVVEVTSPGDTRSEVSRKIAAWLAAGTKVALVVDPARRTVVVHRLGREPEVLTETDTLEGLEPVPGWSVPVRDIFEG